MEAILTELDAVLGAGLVDAPSLDAVRAGKGAIKRGMRGDSVMYIQRALKLYGAVEDGVFTSDVEQLVRTFQKDYGLPADGVVGKRTLAIFDNPDRFKPAEAPKNSRSASIDFKPAEAPKNSRSASIDFKPAEAPSSDSVLDMLKRPYGPLPLWGWSAILGAGAAVIYLVVRKP